MNDINDIPEDMLDEMEKYLYQNESLTPVIREGDIRCLKRIPVEKYWENADQISRPASDEKIQEYLSVSDDISFTLKRKIFIAFCIAFVLTIISFRNF